MPGTTRDSIDVPFVLGHGAQARHYLLTDTAGIREHLRAKALAVRPHLLLAGASAYSRTLDFQAFAAIARRL